MTENCSLHCNLQHPLVLAVDDDEDNLELLTQLLLFVECSFITAKDGKTAVEMARQNHPNLILLDMMLPDISGIEVVKSLQQHSETKDIPIVAVTAMAGLSNQRQFLEGGCLECVTKPYNVDKLEELICHYIYKKN